MLKIDKNKFCEVCNNSISMSQAATTLGIHFGTFLRYAKMYGVYKPNQGLKGGRKREKSKIKLTDVLEGKHPSYATRRVKERIIAAGLKQKICEKCGLTKWNEQDIPLELNHKDGDRTNHKIENIELVCPNCHAQTSTYRGKNKSLNRVIC